jgi:excisionase family DNA binding protein
MRVIEKADIAPLEPLLCSIKAGCAILGVSDRFIIDAIAMGKISAVKTGRRTLLVVQSLKEYAASLPAAKGTPLARRRVTYEIQTMR